jgi:tetratricopeptide (TPR) repeat protein
MASSRLETLKNLLAQKPGDSFLRYGVAMEYRNTGDLASAAREFESLMADDPDYAAAYFHAGQTLERLGKLDEARETYLRGIEVTSRLGNSHARDELQGTLNLLG